MRKIKGFIFDLDGLMVDTEAMALIAWQQALAPYGFELSGDQLCKLIGMGEDEAVVFTNQQLGVQLPAEEVKTQFMENIWAQLEGGVTPLPGLEPLLDALRQHDLVLGVASNSSGSYVRKMLDMLEVSNYFQYVVALEDVARPKPSPESYLMCASLLGLSPRDCWAVEDSPPGVRAALAAGMACAFIPNPYLDPEDIRDLDSPGVREFTCLEALNQSLEEILNNR